MDMKEPSEDPQQEPLPGEYGFPLPRELLYRELGFGGCFAYHNNPRHSVGKKIVTQSLSSKAVNTLCTKELTRRRFKLPTGARTTFHIAFSADGSKVASCHGDHNVYVCDVASGEVIQTLSGHPRTPWCVVFHPTQNDVLASGCLAGQVRVWDLKGGSEVLVTDSGTVIASLAFHPTVRLLAIATFNEIIFWDWGHPYPLARCSTENTKEKVRLVRFDRFGHNLITGITNFPSPPSREEIRRSSRSAGGCEGPFYRPNILSRNNRPRRASPVFVSSHDEMETVDDGEGEVVEEVVVPDHEEAFSSSAADDALIVRENLNARQDRFQESYRQLVSHYEELVSNYQQFLRSRIPRIYETLDNTSPAPSTLVLPDPMLEESQDNADMEINPIETFESDSLPSDPTAAVVIVNAEAERIETVVNSTTLVTNPEPPSPSLPVVLDDELPGPSSRLLFLPNQDAPVDFPRNSNLSTSSMEAHSPSSRSSISGTTVEGESTGARNDTDLRSIEALAQNILEMQNLCSQVRMDAPLAVENQHIMELRVIRRHLELLQEQTRDLQSSIRATLNSLATGSLAALRSHVANATNSTLGNLNENVRRESSSSESFVNLGQATPPTPVEPGPNLEFESHSPSPTLPQAVPRSTLRMETRTDTSETQSRNSRREATQSGPARSGSNGSSRSGGAPNNTLYRIMIATPYSESGRVTSTPLFNRIRVPPMVAMQYEVPDSFNRNTHGSSRNSEEPVAGPSRNTTGIGNSSSSTNRRGRTIGEDGQAGPRRIVREFHLVSGRPGTLLAEEHARHCPFSGRDPYQWRPPPRMRSLYDMGEMPPLVTWPTMETGVEVNTRNFRAVASLSGSNRQSRSPLSSITITIRGGYGNGISSNGQHDLFEGSNNRIIPFMNFSQWLLSSGINSGNLTIDVLVGIYLTIRQISGNSNSQENLESQNSEQWQRAFTNIVPGLALIPPSLRQGQRTPHHQSSHRCQHRRRRTTHWICYNHNGTSSQSSSRRGTLPLAGVRASTSHNSNQNDQSNNQEPLPNANTNTSVQNRIPLNIPEESSSSSSSSSSSGYSSSSSEPICMRTTKKENESCAPSTNTASSHNSSTRPIPSQLESNFSRVFYIRAVDDLIPVYSTVHSSETGLGTEVRESLQASVYYLPIGLFLQGGPWEANTQAVGIHWPPVTREEEYAILDLRVSERPLSVFGTNTRESFPNNRNYPRIRIDYDQTSLRVTLPTGFTLQFIQSGLMLLDCISTSVNLPRPRALEGTLWIDYLGPFLDALERMFGLRHARRTAANVPPGHHRVGAFLRRTPPRVREHGRPSMFSSGPSQSSQPAAASSIPSSSQSNVQVNNSSSGSNNNIGPSRERLPATSSSRRAEVGERLQSVTTRRIITLAPDSSIESNRRRFYDDGSMILSHGYMYDGNSPGGGNYRSDVGERRLYFRHRHSHRNDYSRHHHRSGQSHHGAGNPQAHRGQEGPEGSRFIRLAVDTAASEVLRRNQQHHLDSDNLPVVEAGSAGGFSTLGRPVESRIERVLNERGNRGVHSPSPPGILDESVRNRMRLEEIQMRISMLSQWSRARAMATSGTQTPPNFIRGWQMSTVERPSSSSQTEGANHNSERERHRRAGTGESSGETYRATFNLASVSSPSGGISDNESRTSRRRPYSRIARFLPNETGDNSDEEMLLSIPARIPRLGDQSLHPESDFNGERPSRPEIVASSRREGGLGGASVRHHIDHWVMRSAQPPTSSLLHRYRPAAMVELSGSARTRAPPPVSENSVEPNRPSNTSGNEGAGENESIGRGFHRGGRARGTSNAAGVNGSSNSNSIGNDREEQQHLEAGARFYPGYIPEILITPRTRPPTYYTMDAATTAFLSSRIQKWDFTEFLIPDITKRDDFVVVRECSLHSDACLDVSPDSSFLAVLQPSDSGSYSSVGLYSLQDESLGELLNVYHFDQNTVSVSISPSCDYIVVGYAGRGPLYRFVHPSRNIGKIISIARDEDDSFRLVHVKDLYADGQVAFMSINCMHWVPVSGYGIIYGTNTGDLVLLS